MGGLGGFALTRGPHPWPPDFGARPREVGRLGTGRRRVQAQLLRTCKEEI